VPELGWGFALPPSHQFLQVQQVSLRWNVAVDNGDVDLHTV